MQLCKILILLAVGILCINARVLKRHKSRRQQRPASYATSTTSCGCPLSVIEIPCGCKSILESTYGSLGTCNCQDIFLNETPDYGCGCSYGVFNTEVSNYGRVPAIKLPKAIASCDAAIPIPAINLPGLYDIVLDLPTNPAFPCELPCPCKNPLAPYQCVEGPCSCRMQAPIVEYISPVEVPSPLLKVPYVDPYYFQGLRCNCQPQVVELPTCGCPFPKIECGCQNVNLPCACQNLLNTPCGCDNGLKVSCGLPCNCENPLNCGCPNILQYGLPALNIPCGCQPCQLSPVELPVYGYGCQVCQSSPVELPVYGYGCQVCQSSPVELPAYGHGCQACQPQAELPVYGCGCQTLPPPVIGCGGKYLRQVVLQPPFL